MRRRRTRKHRATRFLLAAVAGGTALALGAIFALDLLGGGVHHEAEVTRAPDAHPSPAASGGPALHFSTTSVDFGLVPLNTEVGYAFSYANVGAKPLHIEDVNVRAVRGC